MSAAHAEAHLKSASVTFRHYLGLPVILHRFQLVQNAPLPLVDLDHMAAGLQNLQANPFHVKLLEYSSPPLPPKRPGRLAMAKDTEESISASRWPSHGLMEKRDSWQAQLPHRLSLLTST